MSQDAQAAARVFGFAVAFEVGIFLSSCSLAWIIGIPLMRQVHITWAGILGGASATLPLLFGMWWCSRSRAQTLREMMKRVDDWVVPIFVRASPLELLAISILAGLGEECLFRGVLQSALGDLIGWPMALTLTSVLFGLAHPMTPTYAVLAGIIGAYLGILNAVAGNLLVPIVTHSLYDFAAITYLVSSTRRASVH